MEYPTTMPEHKTFFLTKAQCKDYTLFIDRDGVINQPIVNDYAKKPEDFIFTDSAVATLGQLKTIFGKVILITNQQGIHKEVMTEEDLENVHLKMYRSMQEEIGDYFDAAFFAPYLNSKAHPWRKPGKGMIIKAMEYFPDIDASRCIVVGDSPGDMQLADNIGAIKVRISNPQFQFDNQDWEFSSLRQFAESLV